MELTREKYNYGEFVSMKWNRCKQIEQLQFSLNNIKLCLRTLSEVNIGEQVPSGGGHL